MPQPSPPSRTEQPDPKRRREPNGKEIIETGRTRPSSEEKVHRLAKQQRISHAPSRGPERGEVQLPEPQAWLPAPMHGGEPLTDDASIRDYNGGIGCHVASVLEEILLLPKDMVELRGLRRNEVFLQTKRFLGMVCIFTPSLFLFFWYNTYFMLYIYIFVCACFIFFFKKAVQSTFRMEEIYHSVSQQLDDERKRRVAAVQTLTIAENSNADLKQKLKEEEQARKSVESALKGAETQAESQRKLANEIKGQLVAVKEQMAALKQQLERLISLRTWPRRPNCRLRRTKAKPRRRGMRLSSTATTSA